MRSLLPLLAILMSLNARAQQVRGRIVDAQSNRPMSQVLAKNLRSGALWVSDSLGNVAFTAFPGDVMRFSAPSYHEVNENILEYGQKIEVALVRAPIQLNEVKVLSPYARYQQDSAFNRLYYRLPLQFSKAQSKLDLSNGIGANGLISDLALGLSGKKKYYRQFASNMQMLEDLRFSGIRYTPEAVAAQTGMNDSAAAQFIQRNPMPTEIARYSGDLEFKMWIRTAYRTERRQDSLNMVRNQR